jgi:hypothetical protein
VVEKEATHGFDEQVLGLVPGKRRNLEEIVRLLRRMSKCEKGDLTTRFFFASRLTGMASGDRMTAFELGVGGRPLLWDGRRTGNPVQIRDGPAAVTK